MPLFFYFILKVILCSSVLFGYYHLFLRNKVYHAYNRFYLLAAVGISLLAPLLNINLWLYGSGTGSNSIKMLQALNSSDEYMEEIIIYSHRNNISSSQLFLIIYCLVSLILLVVLIKLLAHIFSILKTGSSSQLKDVVFIQSDAKGTPFSFFKYIFWNNSIDINSTTGQQIFAHELAHVREKHSADKLFLNIALIFCWINPVFWLIKKELNLIHEFIADKKAVANNDAQALAAMIVTSAYPKYSYLLTNHFFYSPIKRRLQMLSKYNTKKTGYFYRILALPVILFLVAVISIKAKNNVQQILNPVNKITVVIDAGHGGKDAGSISSDGKSVEKDFNLAFAKKIKELNQSSNINIILTREDDTYQSPQEKAVIAKNAGADLFISIHTASEPFSTATNNGMEVYVARDEFSNSTTSKLFASSVIENFKSHFGLTIASNPIQRKVGIWVLQANEFPSILIETGYIGNKKDLEYLKTDEAKNIFAKNILAAIAAYTYNVSATKNESAVIESRSDTLINPREELGYYKGEKIKEIFITENNKQLQLKFASGQMLKISMADAKKEGILLPPPPPASPVPPIPHSPAIYSTTAVTPQPPIPPIAPLPPPEPTNNGDHYNKNNNLNSLPADKQPLVILNGKEIPFAELKNINQADIVNINVLKGEKAINKKYSAAKSVNGVIEITAKENNFITKTASPVFETGRTVSIENIKLSKNDSSKIKTEDKSFTFYDGNKQEDGKIFTKVEQEAVFPGGTDAWQTYLKKNLNASIPVDEGWSEGTYKLIIRFIVAKDGSVSDVAAENFTNSKTAQMCVDFIKNGPGWNAALQNNRKVTSYKKQPITFVIDKQ